MAKKKDYKALNTTPLDTGIKNFTEILKFYMYYAPNIDSCQSNGRIEGNNAEAVLQEMLIRANIRNKTRFLKKIQKNSWAKSGLETDEIDFEDSRILCDKYSNEEELSALLRHIRNALAHGYIYVWKKRSGKFILLVDFDSNKNRCTAKILVSMPILESWKAILENEMATGE